MTGRRVLLVTHSRAADAGVAASTLERLGFDATSACPRRGEPLPETADGFAGCVVFGGPMSANDTAGHPYLRDEMAWIEAALSADTPLLGICLGAQLVARVLGAEVRAHAEGVHELGYYPIEPTPDGHPFFPTRLHVCQWHGEGFDLPREAVRLAEGVTFPNQAFRYGEAVYGLQFHPEVNREIHERWLAKGADELSLPGAQSAEDQRAGRARHEAAMHAWLEGFLRAWLGPA